MSPQDLEHWLRYRELRSGRTLPRGEDPKDDLEIIVLLRVLEGRFAGLPEAARREQAAEWRLWQAKLAETRLQEVVRERTKPTDEEVLQSFRADPAAYALPRHWELQNILKRYPEGAGDAERARLRTAMERVRARALKGEDFALLAKQESESQTRLRGGNLGAVSLDQLSPHVAEVVAKMKPGDLSPLLDLDGGLTLLKCVKILEAQPPSLDRARRAVSLRLGQERFDEAWSELGSRLEGELRAKDTGVPLEGGDPDDVLATFGAGDAQGRLTRRELALYLAGRGIEPRGASSQVLAEALRERLRLEGVWAEARRRGLLDRPDDALLFEWKQRELRARAVEQAEVEGHVPEPDAAALRAAYDAHPGRYVAPALVGLRGLKLALRRDRPRAFYDDARRVGERLAAGEMSFDEAVTALRPGAELVELGRLSADQVWTMGLNVDKAVAATPPGGTTPLLQEGRTLWILHVLSKQAERQLSFEEAREQIRSALLSTARKRAVDAFRRRVVDEQEVSVVR